MIASSTADGSFVLGRENLEPVTVRFSLLQNVAYGPAYSTT